MPQFSFTHKVLTAVALTAVFIAAGALFWQAGAVLLLLFAAIVWGCILNGLVVHAMKWTKLPRRLSLLLVVCLLIGLVVGATYAVRPILQQQLNQVQNELPGEWEQLMNKIARSASWAIPLTQKAKNPGDVLAEQLWEQGRSLMEMLGIFSNVFSVVAGALLLVILGIYMAAEPKFYQNGILRLFPHHRRPRMKVVGDRIAFTLQWWIFGQCISMLVLFSISTLMLWWLDVPLAFLLGALTALMTFIPNLGPVLAGIPTVLIALTQGPTTAIYVTILYVVLQNLEGYFITPVIHRRIISMPPVAILGLQAILLKVSGFLGVLLAMPLVATVMVIVQTLYVEDALDDNLQRPVLAASPDGEGK